MPTTTASPAESTKRSRTLRPSDSVAGLLAKIILLGLVDAFAVYVLIVLFLQEKWIVLVLAAAVTLLINWIYLRRGGLPANAIPDEAFRFRVARRRLTLDLSETYKQIFDRLPVLIVHVVHSVAPMTSSPMREYP